LIAEVGHLQSATLEADSDNYCVISWNGTEAGDDVTGYQV